MVIHTISCNTFSLALWLSVLAHISTMYACHFSLNCTTRENHSDVGQTSRTNESHAAYSTSQSASRELEYEMLDASLNLFALLPSISHQKSASLSFPFRHASRRKASGTKTSAQHFELGEDSLQRPEKTRKSVSVWGRPFNYSNTFVMGNAHTHTHEHEPELYAESVVVQHLRLFSCRSNRLSFV